MKESIFKKSTADYSTPSRRRRLVKERFNRVVDAFEAAGRIDALWETERRKKALLTYSKTRSTYEAYRQAGYSKKFFEAHREKLTLHKAAKQAFDELGVRKIPKVKELSAEYAEILTGKKAVYAEYRKVRDEAQELAIAVRNISSLYEAETKEQERQSQVKTH